MISGFSVVQRQSQQVVENRKEAQRRERENRLAKKGKKK